MPVGTYGAVKGTLTPRELIKETGISKLFLSNTYHLDGKTWSSSYSKRWDGLT